MTDWIYILGGTLYATMACLLVFAISKDELWKEIHYYKPDDERGGYIGQDGNWVARKVLWRECGWYGVVILVAVSFPLIALGVLVWELWLKRLFARKVTPASFSGGDGSSCEAAIVIDAENSQDGIGAEYRYIAERHGMYKVAWKRHFQAKIRSEGREYDLMTIMLTADGTERKYWFDITSFHGKWR